MMVERLVDPNETLDGLRSRLAIRSWLDLKELTSGTAICVWCGKTKSAHLYDGRCSTYATSQLFTSKKKSETEKVDKALSLIQELLEL